VRKQLIRGGPPTADLGVGTHKVPADLLEFAELRHFALGFADGRRRGQGLGDGFALDFIGETEMGAMTGLSRSMAATTGLATPTRGTGDATGAKVAELGDLSHHRLPSLF